MNIHSSLVMPVYIISRDGVGDGSGLIIKSSFNCILLHYNDVSELARLSLSFYICVCVQALGEERCGWSTLGDIRHPCLLLQLIWRLEL